VVVLLAGFIFLALASPPRRVDGKTLREWVDECSIRQFTNYFFSVQYWGPRIRKFGPSAVPELVNMMEDKHPFKQKLYDFMFRRRLTNQWMNDLKLKAKIDEQRPGSAAYFLFLMGPAAEPAVPALVRQLTNTQVVSGGSAVNALIMRVNAINALGAIHQHPEIVVPVLSNLLTSNPIVASQAASAMRCFGTNAASAIPALRNYPTNSTSFSQTQVMLTLAELAPEASAEIIVPYCIKTIGSDRINESTCVQILWRVGAPAGNVVPALIKLSAEKTSAGLAAPYALKRIDPVAAANLWPTLPRYAGPHSKSFFTTAAELEDFIKRAKAMGPEGFSYLTNLVANRPISGNPTYKAFCAAYALGEMGPAATGAIPVLEEATADPQSYIWPAATAALMKIRGESPAPLFEQAGDPTDSTTWSLVVKVLAQFDARAEPAIPEIVAAISRSRANDTTEAVGCNALRTIQRRPDLCVPVLASVLDSPSSFSRSSAMDALLAFGADARPALPKVTEALNDLDPYVRESAESLVKILDPSALTNSVAK
jgi:HEAT repeat protein